VRTHVVVVRAKDLAFGPPCDPLERNRARELPSYCHVGDDGEALRDSIGSGIVYRAAEGLIVTAAHIVKYDKGVELVLPDGSIVPATVVGKDDEENVALLRTSSLPGDDLAWSTSTPAIGTSVVVVGQAYNLGIVASQGIVTGVFPVEGRPAAVFIDAQFHKAMSGAPVVNLRGEILAMGFAIFGSAREIAPGVFGVGADASRLAPAIERILAQARPN
jgi:S1-C subfamily serine protease